ncbi:hypothetical protein [Leyella stercorea]|nr:hypothetical protein [Leyella stercorea]
MQISQLTISTPHHLTITTPQHLNTSTSHLNITTSITNKSL